ncbi:hypothetical protein CNR27_10035 [Luteimonas chenhongjianii]|uniref:Uncharacterized protein n=1 Tax=Luteimonas chenhongjianii TaxID=2006110 RepID=A0A290XF32_9GAMM|nr:hypothetical protein [Luteimonas chenhongjianii]ATD67727.1 hypothetical protein CNR27_10035 [Luteimonas chenhongjianii]
MPTDSLMRWLEPCSAEVRRWPREALDPLQGPPNRAAIAAALQCTRDADPDARAGLASSVVTFGEALALDQRRALVGRQSRQGTFHVPPPAAAAPTQLQP